MKTKRQLDAENKTMRAQLATHQHETRKALNERLKRAEEEVKRLRAQLPTPPGASDGAKLP